VPGFHAAGRGGHVSPVPTKLTNTPGHRFQRTDSCGQLHSRPGLDVSTSDMSFKRKNTHTHTHTQSLLTQLYGK
jgi:hypothetical protein